MESGLGIKWKFQDGNQQQLERMWATKKNRKSSRRLTWAVSEWGVYGSVWIKIQWVERKKNINHQHIWMSVNRSIWRARWLFCCYCCFSFIRTYLEQNYWPSFFMAAKVLFILDQNLWNLLYFSWIGIHNFGHNMPEISTARV